MKKILFFLAVAFAAPSFAAKLPGFNTFANEVDAARATIHPFGRGSGTSIGPVAPPANMSGWTPAGNYGAKVDATGTTMTMSAGGDVFLAGTKYPFQAGYSVPPSLIFDALALLCNTPVTCALALAAPAVIKWVAQDHENNIRIRNSATEKKLNKSNCSDGTCSEWQYADKGWQTTSDAACGDAVKFYNALQAEGTAPGDPVANTYTFASSVNLSCLMNRFYYGSPSGTQGATLTKRTVPDSSSEQWLPASMDDIAPYMTTRMPAPQIIQELLDRGGDIKLPDPVVTGPSSLDGPTETITNPDGTKTVKTTKSNFQTSGNTVTNTSNVTTTTVVNVDNSVQSSTTSSVTNSSSSVPKADPPANPCDQNPDSVGCAKLGDVPETQKIPSLDVPVSITPTIFAAPSGCPAPMSGVIQVLAFTKAWTISYQPMCDAMVNLRLLFLAIGAAAAAWLFMEGLKV